MLQSAAVPIRSSASWWASFFCITVVCDVAVGVFGVYFDVVACGKCVICCVGAFDCV